jgi:rare lipoprotein A
MAFHFKSIQTMGVIVGVGLLLLTGCASEPPKLETGYRQLSRYPAQARKKAYNRPYRVKGQTYYPMASAAGYSETGIASWYGQESGSTTSMGLRFDPDGISAAHRTLPLPSKVRVTNLANGRSAMVIVNDRGPFHPGRLIDLSRGAARLLSIGGLTRVKVDYVGLP